MEAKIAKNFCGLALLLQLVWNISPAIAHTSLLMAYTPSPPVNSKLTLAPGSSEDEEVSFEVRFTPAATNELAAGRFSPIQRAPVETYPQLLPLNHSQIFTTPLELSGLTPLWVENFSDGSIDRMQYTWAKGYNSALRSFVMPGAVYLGKEGATVWPHVEQEINNFKAYTGEPLPNILEFDVLTPVTGVGRLSLRPRRRGDFAHMRLGYPDNKTSVQFGFTSGQTGGPVFQYNQNTGPNAGWAHITVSYRQYVQNDIVYAHYVLAINEEVQEYSAPSGITNPDWLTYWNQTKDADGWSIEHTSEEVLMGKYIANVRAYNGFISRSEMITRLQGRVTNYLGQLPNPRTYTGPVKLFQVHKNLTTQGPNAMAYAEQIGPLTLKFDGSLSSAWKKMISYNWTFGDGTTGSGRIVNHTYAQSGSYQVKLTVINKKGTNSVQNSQAVYDTFEMTVLVGGPGSSLIKTLYLPLVFK